MNKPPDNGNLLASLSKTEVNSKLTKKYKDVIKHFNADNIRERLLGPEELNDADDDDGEYCEIGDQDDDSFVLQGAITDDRVLQKGGHNVQNSVENIEQYFKPDAEDSVGPDELKNIL